MSTRRWTDDLLDSLRVEGDPLGDDVVAAYFRDIQGELAGSAEPAQPAGADPSVLFRRLALGQPDRAAEDADAHVRAYLQPPAGQLPDLPAWVDPARVAEGQECFGRWGPHVFTALYAASLPTAYACWRGVEVLGLTARLVTDAKRRLNETAQFHLDVMTPGGLDPGARGYDDVRHIRLMHAAVRWLIDHDPRAEWDPARGRPLNQEDLLETLLTFTQIVFEVFDRTGVGYSEDEANAYLHVWSLIGHLLGIRPDLLPLTRADTTVLMPMVRRRQFGESPAGRHLTAALIDQGRRVAPPGLRGLPATTIRFYLGDSTADLLGVPPSDWTRILFGPLAELTRLFAMGRAHHLLLSAFSAQAGFRMLELAVRAERSGGRPPFAVPTELADRWGVTSRGARKAGARHAVRPAGRG